MNARPRDLFAGFAIAIAIMVLPGCQPPHTVRRDSSVTPGGKPDSAALANAEIYRFLNEPGVSVESLAAIIARLPYDSISLRREPCYGTCPMYEATLYKDGRARYHGERFVERLGDFTGEVMVQDYARLGYLLDRFGFMTLPDSFSIHATDLPGATLTAHRSPGGIKSVSDYGYVGPVELWTMREVFDGVLTRIAWKKTGT